MILIYNIFALVFQFVVWFVPNIAADGVSVALLGFFIGPMFPCIMSLSTKVLPEHLHVSVIGFIAAFGEMSLR